MKRIPGIILMILFVTATAYADFFPVELGWGRKDLDEINAAYEFEEDMGGKTVYRIYSPLPDKDLKNFWVVMSGREGATQLVAATGNYRCDGDGIALKEYYEKYKNELIDEYGDPTEEGTIVDGDFLTGTPETGSDFFASMFWSGYEDSDFLEKQYNADRALFSVWYTRKGGIMLQAKAESPTQWRISIERAKF